MERGFNMPRKSFFGQRPISKFPNLRIAALKCRSFTSLHLPEYWGEGREQNPHSLWPVIRRFRENFPMAEYILVETEDGYQNPEDESPLWTSEAKLVFVDLLATAGHGGFDFMVGNDAPGYSGLRFERKEHDRVFPTTMESPMCQSIMNNFKERFGY
jgi:hypothetical protein